MSVVYDGVLQKKGKVNRAWKTRYCELRKHNNSDVFLHYYDSKATHNSLGTITISEVYAVEVINDSECKINEIPEGILINSSTRTDKKYSFLIDTTDRKYVFAAFDPKSFFDWIHMLHKYTYGSIIKQGWLHKKGDMNKQWKQRYFVLSKRNIKYYEDFQQTKYISAIQLNSVLSVSEGILHNDHQKYKYIFELNTPKRIWILCADNDQERDSWIQHIQSTFARPRKTTDLSLHMQAAILEKKLDIKNRKYHLKTYSNCFIGSDAVKYIIKLEIAANEHEAIIFGRKLIKNNIIRHVENEHNFKNKDLYYRFTPSFHQRMVDNLNRQESIPIQLKAEMLEKRVEIKTRKWNLKTYPDCFIGSEAIKFMFKLRIADNEKGAIQFGNRLIESGLVIHVAKKHSFKNKHIFYRFTPKFYKAKENDTGATLEAFERLVSMDMISDMSSIPPELADNYKIEPQKSNNNDENDEIKRSHTYNKSGSFLGSLLHKIESVGSDKE
eukprot:139565_1